MERVSQCTDYLKFQLEKSATKIGSDKMRRLKKAFKNVVILVFDEKGMISAEDMGMIETYAKQAAHQEMRKNSFLKTSQSYCL